MKIDRVSRKDEKNVSVYFDNGERLILSEDTFKTENSTYKILPSEEPNKN